jgi:hypothetical protein
VVFPSRQAISELTGMHLANISSATTSLERLGWLKKNGKGGYSKATRYTITVPATVAEQATGPVADSARGKEHTSEHTNRTHKGESAESEGFAECWSVYPKRDGGNSREDALKAYRGRLKARVTPADMLCGVKRYASYCSTKCIIGTQFVMRASRFFGTGNHWAEKWGVAHDAASDDSGMPDFMAVAMRTNKEAAHVD